MKTINNGFPTAVPISAIKEDIEKNKDKNIKITEFSKMNKKSINEYEGKINGIYSNLFTICIKNKFSNQNKSFNYSDISIGLLSYKIY